MVKAFVGADIRNVFWICFDRRSRWSVRGGKTAKIAFDVKFLALNSGT